MSGDRIGPPSDSPADKLAAAVREFIRKVEEYEYDAGSADAFGPLADALDEYRRETADD